MDGGRSRRVSTRWVTEAEPGCPRVGSLLRDLGPAILRGRRLRGGDAPRIRLALSPSEAPFPPCTSRSASRSAAPSEPRPASSESRPSLSGFPASGWPAGRSSPSPWRSSTLTTTWELVAQRLVSKRRVLVVGPSATRRRDRRGDPARGRPAIRRRGSRRRRARRHGTSRIDRGAVADHRRAAPRPDRPDRRREPARLSTACSPRRRTASRSSGSPTSSTTPSAGFRWTG